MKKVRYVLYALVLVIGLPLAVDFLVFGGKYSQPLVLLMNRQAREYQAVDAAMALSYTDPAAANIELQTLVNTASDDIVYERAVRQLARNNVTSAPADSLTDTVKLATDPRIRAEARAGALETLAEYYTSQYSPYTTGDLDAAIFADPVMAQVREAADPTVGSQQIILEYANQVSVRPYATALLLPIYGQAWYEGDTRAKLYFDEAWTNFQNLISATTETSPLLPKAHAAAVAGLLYASVADAANATDYLPELELVKTLDSSNQLVAMIAQLTGQPEDDFLGADYAPLAQFYTILNAVNNLPSNVRVTQITDAYSAYLSAHPGIDLSVVAPNIQTTINTENPVSE